MAEIQSCEDFTYTLLPDGTAEITKWSGRDEALDIPSQLNGYSVTSIEEDAFSGCKSLALTVTPDSYAHSYAEQEGIAFQFE